MSKTKNATIAGGEKKLDQAKIHQATKNAPYRTNAGKKVAQGLNDNRIFRLFEHGMEPEAVAKMLHLQRARTRKLYEVWQSEGEKNEADIKESRIEVLLNLINHGHSFDSAQIVMGLDNKTMHELMDKVKKSPCYRPPEYIAIESLSLARY